MIIMKLPLKRRRSKRARLVSALGTTVMYILGSAGGVVVTHSLLKLAQAGRLNVHRCPCGGFDVHIYDDAPSKNKVLSRTIEFHYHSKHDDDDGDEIEPPEEEAFVKPDEDDGEDREEPEIEPVPEPEPAHYYWPAEA